VALAAALFKCLAMCTTLITAIDARLHPVRDRDLTGRRRRAALRI